MMGRVGQISKVSRQFLSKLHDFFTNLHDFSSFKSFMESLLEIGSIFKTLEPYSGPNNTLGTFLEKGFHEKWQGPSWLSSQLG